MMSSNFYRKLFTMCCLAMCLWTMTRFVSYKDINKLYTYWQNVLCLLIESAQYYCSTVVAASSLLCFRFLLRFLATRDNEKDKSSNENSPNGYLPNGHSSNVYSTNDYSPKPYVHKDGSGTGKYPPLQAETRETNQEDGKKKAGKKWVNLYK